MSSVSDEPAGGLKMKLLPAGGNGTILHWPEAKATWRMDRRPEKSYF